MTIREAMQSFMDEDHLYIERPNQSDGPETGNGIRERCVLEMLSHKKRESKQEHMMDFMQTIRSCEVEINKVPIRGLYNRGPRKLGDKAAHDDRRCLSAVSSVLNLPFAREIYDYGKRNFWSFNNLNPNHFSLRDCDIRFAGVVPSYRLNASKDFLPLEDVSICSGLLLSALSKKPGQKIIWWLQVEAFTVRGLFESQVGYWWQCLESQYGSMGEVFAAYYENPKHPYVSLSPV